MHVLTRRATERDWVGARTFAYYELKRLIIKVLNAWSWEQQIRQASGRYILQVRFLRRVVVVVIRTSMLFWYIFFVVVYCVSHISRILYRFFCFRLKLRFFRSVFVSKLKIKSFIINFIYLIYFCSFKSERRRRQRRMLTI